MQENVTPRSISLFKENLPRLICCLMICVSLIITGVMIGNVRVEGGSGGSGGNGGSAMELPKDYLNEKDAMRYLGFGYTYGGSMYFEAAEIDAFQELIESGALDGTFLVFREEHENIENNIVTDHNGNPVLDENGYEVYGEDNVLVTEEFRVFSKDRLRAFMEKMFEGQAAVQTTTSPEITEVSHELS
ncbi:MAG: hypothetical protein FWF05_03060 [Oscillospiraceae bacterium]|nr:hypothetical protein [Oscillospiraceae bacterium]